MLLRLRDQMREPDGNRGFDILLVMPVAVMGPDPRILLDMGVQLEILRRAGFRAGVWLLDVPCSPDSIVRSFRKITSSIVLYSIPPGEMDFIAALAPVMKKAAPEVHFIAGGVYPTVAPDEALSIEGIDSLLIGEGEGALVEFVGAFVEHKDIRTIRNFWFQTPAREVEKNPLRPLIENLDILPFADRSFYNHTRLVDIHDGALAVRASRGCHRTCQFCVELVIRDIYRDKGSWYRFRSPGNIIAEIMEQKARVSFNRVLFVDELFPTRRDWLIQFAERFHSQIGLPFEITSCREDLDEDNLNLLREAGCDRITLGIETGNEKFRRRICEKNQNNEKIIELVRIMRSLGIKVRATAMTGLPHETSELAEETLGFIRTLAPDEFVPEIYFPMPGASLYRHCIQNDYITKRAPGELQSDESLLSLPDRSAEEIRDWMCRARRFSSHLTLAGAAARPGYCDILATLMNLEQDGGASCPYSCGRHTLGLEEQFCMAQMPNTKVSIPLTLREPTFIRFGVGIEPTLNRYSPEMFFRFTIVLVQSNREQLVVERNLRPGETAEDCGWRIYEIPILDAASGPAILRFEYRNSINVGRPVQGLWIHPVLDQRLAVWEQGSQAWTQADVDKMQEELLNARSKMQEMELQKKTRDLEIAKLHEEIEKTLGLLKRLQERIFNLEVNEQSLNMELEHLREIKKAYDKTLRGRLHKLMGRKSP